MIADAVKAAPGQWAVSHVIVAIGLGLVLLAVLVIREQFRRAGEQRWSEVGVPPLIVGATLLGTIVGSEITLAAVVDSGGDVLAVLEASATLTWPLVLGASAVRARLAQLRDGVLRARILRGALNWGAIVALVVIPKARYYGDPTRADDLRDRQDRNGRDSRETLGFRSENRI